MLVNIEAERVRKQLTKEDLSEKLDVSLKTYYNWINEERDVPSKKLKQMALIFGTSMDYLSINPMFCRLFIFLHETTLRN